MNKYILILFFTVIFISNAAVAMASGSAVPERGGMIASVVMFVCVSMTAAFLIFAKRK